MLKLRQYFCRHDFKCIAKHNSTSQNLWKCDKCNVHVIQHWGLGTYYKCKVPNIDGWIFNELNDWKIVGVTLGWDFKPHIYFDTGNAKGYFPEKVEKVYYSEYFQHGEWPTDPKTGEQLPIVPYGS